MVTIGKRGGISLNQASHEAIGDPSAVELLFDHRIRRVAIRSSDIDSPDAFTLKKNRSGNAFYFFGRSFLDDYKVGHSKATHYEVTIEDGMLVFDVGPPASEESAL